LNSVFESALETGNIAGAYLIEGSSWEAVSSEVDGFLLRLFCDKKTACGECPGCRKYKAGVHADILRIEAGGKSIKVDAVRDIPSFVYKKAYEGSYKAVIIPEAHEMTEQAQNALLKMLEEPPDNTVFVLGSRDSKNLLPTILSRCIILKAQNRLENAEDSLIEEFGLSTVKARILMKAADNDYFLARKYADNNYFEMRDDMVTVLGRLFSAKNMATSATEKIILKYEQQLMEAFSVALIYIKDVLNYKHTGNEGYAANSDRMEDIKRHAELSDMKLVNTADIMAGFITKCSQCPGLNKKLELTGTLFSILEVTI